MKTATVQPLECCHADTCLPDYWSGHHLPHVAIPVWPGMSLADIRRELLSELNQGAVSGSDMPREYEESDLFWLVVRRMRAAVRRMKPARKGQRRFFLDLEPQTEDDETVYAFFVFRPLEA